MVSVAACRQTCTHAGRLSRWTDRCCKVSSTDEELLFAPVMCVASDANVGVFPLHVVDVVKDPQRDPKRSIMLASRLSLVEDRNADGADVLPLRMKLGHIDRGRDVLSIPLEEQHPTFLIAIWASSCLSKSRLVVASIKASTSARCPAGKSSTCRCRDSSTASKQVERKLNGAGSR